MIQLGLEEFRWVIRYLSRSNDSAQVASSRVGYVTILFWDSNLSSMSCGLGPYVHTMTGFVAGNDSKTSLSDSETSKKENSGKGASAIQITASTAGSCITAFNARV
jgi:hypothetical protein